MLQVASGLAGRRRCWLDSRVPAGIKGEKKPSMDVFRGEHPSKGSKPVVTIPRGETQVFGRGVEAKGGLSITNVKISRQHVSNHCASSD